MAPHPTRGSRIAATGTSRPRSWPRRRELAVTIRRTPAEEEILELLPGMEFLVSERTGVIDVI